MSGTSIHARGPNGQHFRPQTESGLKFLRKVQQALSPSTRGSVKRSQLPRGPAASWFCMRPSEDIHSLKQRHCGFVAPEQPFRTDIFGPRNAFFISSAFRLTFTTGYTPGRHCILAITDVLTTSLAGDVEIYWIELEATEAGRT